MNIKLSKLIVILAALTVFALLYVWQQTEVFRLAYIGQRNASVFEDLLDKNSILRYNIGKQASLICVGSKIMYSGSDFEMPDYYRLVSLEAPVNSVAKGMQPAKRQTLLARVFSVKRQAEAKTITPSARR
jgi:hypothetical protein